MKITRILVSALLAGLLLFSLASATSDPSPSITSVWVVDETKGAVTALDSIDAAEQASIIDALKAKVGPGKILSVLFSGDVTVTLAEGVEFPVQLGFAASGSLKGQTQYLGVLVGSDIRPTAVLPTDSTEIVTATADNGKSFATVPSGGKMVLVSVASESEIDAGGSTTLPKTGDTAWILPVALLAAGCALLVVVNDRKLRKGAR